VQTLSFVESARQTLEETKQYLRGDAPEGLRLRLQDLERVLTIPQWLTSKEAADLLGVASPTTVKNWLEGGHFPGSRRTAGGHWRFLLADVLAVKHSMEDVRGLNRLGEVRVVDLGDQDPGTPTF
jgi:excisionase family DNA binding protein